MPVMTYDIIESNLKKLEEAKKSFPKLVELEKLQKAANKVKDIDYKSPTYANDLKQRTELQQKIEVIRNVMIKLGLNEYVSFMSWTIDNDKIIYPKIDFNELKEALINDCFDQVVKEFIKTKTKRGLITFISSDQFLQYTGFKRIRASKASGYRRNMSPNLSKSHNLLANFLIQNEAEYKSSITNPRFGYYINNLPDFQSSAVTELEVTNDIINSLKRKIKNTKYDFRRLNYHLLQKEIKDLIYSMMLNVDKDDRVRCIEAVPGLTLSKLYDVVSFGVNESTGVVSVTVLSDYGYNSNFNYRLFESAKKLRDDRIDDILSFLED
jgi:hypothetical protein